MLTIKEKKLINVQKVMILLMRIKIFNLRGEKIINKNNLFLPNSKQTSLQRKMGREEEVLIFVVRKKKKKKVN